MRYLLLIYRDDSAIEALSPEELSAAIAKYTEFSEELHRRGILEGGSRLHPATAATTVQVRDGEVVATDGPFAETNEHVGGFYLVECQDLDEAIEVASKVPGVQWGAVEVRPIWEE